MTAVPRQRRTNEERSAETRAKLIAATLDVLVGQGYARATTADIADIAGVSRGALHHHFDSKDDLVVQAVGSLLDEATATIEATAVRVKRGDLSLDGFLDVLWDMFSGRLFLVTLEHVTAARHDPNLKAALVPLVRHFHAALDQIWRRFFEGSGLSAEEVETTLNATLCLLRGMGLQTVLREDDQYYRALLSLWKDQLRRLLAPALRTP